MLPCGNTPASGTVLHLCMPAMWRQLTTDHKETPIFLDQSENLATWKALRGKTSEILDLDSGHIAMDILEFGPKSGLRAQALGPILKKI